MENKKNDVSKVHQVNEYFKDIKKFAPSGREFYGEDEYLLALELARGVDKRIAEKKKMKKKSKLIQKKKQDEI